MRDTEKHVNKNTDYITLVPLTEYLDPQHDLACLAECLDPQLVMENRLF